VENLVVGNGSDELLALATRAFVEPCSRQRRLRTDSRTVVQFFAPSYSLYPVLAAIHGAQAQVFPLNPDFSLPSLRELRQSRQWDFDAALTFITTPNAPSGRSYPTAELEAICQRMSGVVVLDEAYADFARENALALALQYPNVMVSRTFSKAYSLCFQRVGYFVGHPELIGALHKIRDSYNVNGLGQVAAQATLEDLPYYRRHLKTIRSTRETTALRLSRLGFQVLPSQTNFILTRPPGPGAEDWTQRLRTRRVLVRWFPEPKLRGYLRITIGTPQEMNRLLREIDRILGTTQAGGDA
jgi:histidinol-phosphate aminotransferase